jgi:hypothetical protein
MGAKLGSAERPPEKVTAVLGIGFNKMCVNDDVVQVDDQNANVYPIAENNRTLVPVSRIVDAFGGTSAWDSKTNTTYTLGNCKVSHVIGSKDVLIKGQSGAKKDHGGSLQGVEQPHLCACALCAGGAGPVGGLRADLPVGDRLQ